MDAAYGRSYRDLYERHWWWRAREEFVTAALRQRLNGRGRERILDVGCGDGLFFRRLAEFGDVEGVESEAALISPGGNRFGAIHITRFDESFRPGKRYSVILFLDVLEHLDDPEGALRHAADLLDEHGIIVATVPAFMALWTTHDVLNAHNRRYTAGDFGALARRSGVEVEHDRYFFHWMFAAKLLARAIESVASARPGGPRIPPAWINTAAYWFSRAESWALRYARIPFGGSLLLVGTRAGSKA